jgi:COP9 signalosome complex subunit 5
MHARSGGTLEVMGMLLGKIDGENMIVMDSFALPVEGTGKIYSKISIRSNI